ncbi:MAG: hypothetical protein ACR2QE_05370 [Acidimicrobiales bacterium]
MKVKVATGVLVQSVLLALVPATTAAAQTTPVVTVSPDAVLEVGDTITVSGTGLTTSGSFRFAAVCLESLLDQGADWSTACDLDAGFNILVGPAILEPTFETSFELLSDTIEAGEPRVPHSCRIERCVGTIVSQTSVGGSTTGLAHADDALSFGGPPTVTATPDTDLLDGQEVVVNTVGVPSVGPIALVTQCVDALVPAAGTLTDVCSIGFTALTGSSATITVDRDLRVGGVDYDCAVELCVIGVVETNFDLSIPILAIHTAPIEFRSVPNVSAEPDTDLLHGTAVTVRGRNLPVNGYSRVVGQCLDSLIAGAALWGQACDTSFDTFPDTSLRPTITRTIDVERVITVGGTAYDCAQVACVAAVGTTSGSSADLPLLHIDTAPLQFRSGPTLVLLPATNLYDHSIVTVHAAGLPTAGLSRTALQCVSALVSDSFLPFDGCDPAAASTPSFSVDPTFTGEIAVEREITVDGTDYDCTTTACVIALTDTDSLDPNDPAIHVIAAPINFAERPVVTATPDSDLAEGDTIVVNGVDLPPTGFLTSTQCVASLVDEHIDVGTACDLRVRGDEDFLPVSTYSSDLTVRRELTVDGVDYNCAEVECVAAITGGNAFGLPATFVLTAPLDFGPSLEITVEPKLVGGRDAWVVVTCSRRAEVTIEVEVQQDRPLPATAAGEATLDCDDRAGTRIALEQTEGKFWWFHATYGVTASAEDQGTAVTASASGDTIVLPFWWPGF